MLLFDDSKTLGEPEGSNMQIRMKYLNQDQIRKLGRLRIREAGLITELIISLVSLIFFLVSLNFET